MKRLVAYGMVGGVGFVVDACVLTVLSQAWGMNVYLARVVSFVVATLATWLLNRTMVFKAEASAARRKRNEYFRYFAVQTGGAFINLSVFSALIAAFPVLRTAPVLPLAAGSAFGLIFNFAGASRWVFAQARE